jgi:predicted GTPase
VGLDRVWKAIGDVLFNRAQTRAPDAAEARQRAQAAAPVVWLLGKTGAGKTAVISALTGDSRAEIGEGFAPCTRTAAFYDVPLQAPLLRFLDTRGLGETSYDPTTDIAWCEGQSHLVLVAVGARASPRLAGGRRSDRTAPALPGGRRPPRHLSLYGNAG